MAGRTDSSDDQFDERRDRHEASMHDETILNSLKTFRVDIISVENAMRDLKDVFPPRMFKATTRKEFSKRCQMSRIEEDNLCLQDFLSEGGFELIDVLGDGNCGYYSTIIGLVGQSFLPFRAIKSNARLQATMLLLRKFLHNFMKNEAENLSEAISRDSLVREVCVYDAELDQESRSAKLSGVWDERITIETYCKYIRYDNDAFLSAFGLVAIAASFKIAVVVYNAIKEGNRVKTTTTVYDGSLYARGLMKSLHYEDNTRVSDSFPVRIEMVLLENHFMLLRPKGIPGNKLTGDEIANVTWLDDASGNLVQPPLLVLNMETDRTSPLTSPDDKGLMRSLGLERRQSGDIPDEALPVPKSDLGNKLKGAGIAKKKMPVTDRTSSPLDHLNPLKSPVLESHLSKDNSDGVPQSTEGSRFSDDPFIMKIREIRADPTLRMKEKRKSIVSFCGSLQTSEARTRSETSKNPGLNTQLLHTAGIRFDESSGTFKIGNEAVTDLTSYGAYFLEVVKALGPIKMDVQPVMAASDYVVPRKLRTEVPMKLPAEGCRLCLAYAVAGALDYMGQHEAASIAREESFKWCNSPPEVAIALMEKLFSQFIPEFARPVVYGRHKTGRKTRYVTLEYIFEQRDGCLWVVFPILNDNANHSFCAIDNLIFDTVAPKALSRSKETADFLYGDAVTQVHARHYKYPITSTRKRKRKRKKRLANWAAGWVPEDTYDLL